MSAILTRPQRVGAVLKNELWREIGYCRKTVDVAVVSGMKVGAVLYDAAGTLTLVDVANTAAAEAILIDDSVYDLAAGTHALTVLFRGPAAVSAAALSYAADVDTALEKAAVNAALEAATGIAVYDGMPVYNV